LGLELAVADDLNEHFVEIRSPHPGIEYEVLILQLDLAPAGPPPARPQEYVKHLCRRAR
jgi:hypothetical protein